MTNIIVSHNTDLSLWITLYNYICVLVTTQNWTHSYELLVLTMTNTIASHNTDLSLWITLYNYMCVLATTQN
jgi:hypothetical protein